MTFLERLKAIVAQIERGEWSPVSAAFFISEDAETGFITVIQMPENGIEDVKRLLLKVDQLYSNPTRVN